METPNAKVDDDALNRSVKIIERRVNELGLTEPVIQRQGKDRIIVELPGVKDPEKAIAMLGRTALLEFKDMSGKTVMTGNDLKDSKATVGQNGKPVVGLDFSDEGGKKFALLTSQNIGKQISILLDGEVLTSPVVNEAITGGKAQISGSRNVEEAERLAILLRSGSLPVKLEMLENRTVGPTLGQDSKDKSVKAFAIGLAGVFLFMDREIIEGLQYYETKINQTLVKNPERKDFAVKRLYTPLDTETLNYTANIGFPGEYPFTRGVQPTMYRGRLWTMRAYSGFATAEETNARYKYLLGVGQTGLSVAMDLPTQIGLDSDADLAQGEVGKVGVAIDSLADMEQLFAGIPLDKVSTSMMEVFPQI